MKNRLMHMKKQLGIWMLTALVVGNMIGSGVFLLPASLASFGSITVFSWVATAIGAILLAMVFAKLSTLFPKTGGPYLYCKEGFGNFIGFQVAYNYWIYMWVGNAAIAVAFTGYLATFWPAVAHSNLLAFCMAAGIVWFFTIVNIIGVHLAGRFQLILTILKFVPLLLIAFIGIFFVDGHNLAYFNVSGKSNFSALSGGAMLTLWAFLGLESASIPADNVRNPEKTIPRATILGTTLTALVYIVSTVAIMGVIPMPQLQESTAPFADLAGRIFGGWGMYVMGAAAIISCAGALNGWILLQGQIPMAAARDRLFPKKFTHLSKGGAPIFGILLSSVLITLVLILNFNKNLVDQFTFIISLATLAALIAYLYSSVAEFVIYLKYPEKKETKTVIKTLTISGLAFLYAFWATVSAGQEIVFYGALLMFTSIPIYGWMEWKKHLESHENL
ncbi:amino acid permease [Candidatus Neptunochlamydia vexilliferae]|nr:amino acid permease [Candidatus Neptunochlamydia vexilliferae]